MPRRHSWLQDYNYELDHGPQRMVRGDGDNNVAGRSPSPEPISPVNININVSGGTANVNLGDLITKLAKGKITAKEALTELVEEKRKQLLQE